jgi:hypothetical protein
MAQSATAGFVASRRERFSVGERLLLDLPAVQVRPHTSPDLPLLLSPAYRLPFPDQITERFDPLVTARLLYARDRGRCMRSSGSSPTTTWRRFEVLRQMAPKLGCGRPIYAMPEATLFRRNVAIPPTELRIGNP